MFALFPKFGARTRTQDLWPFLISETGLKFLIWTQGKIHSGNRASPVNRAHMKRPLVSHFVFLCKIYFIPSLVKGAMSRYLLPFCGRQEEPAILISRLLLRMRRMYLASIRLTSTKNEWNLITRVWTFYHSCFDNLSHETYAKHIVGPSIVVARKPLP